LTYQIGKEISPLIPVNKGSAVPEAVYGQVSTFAGSGISGSFTPLDGIGTAASFAKPTSMVLEASGNMYITEDFRIRKITPAGVVSTVAGRDFPGYADGVGTNVRLSYPQGLSIDGAGNKYFADWGNDFIRKISNTDVVSTIAGNGFYGSVNGTALSSNFYQPTATAVDAAGNIYVADPSNNRIRKISVAGEVTNFAGSGLRGSSDGMGTTASFSYPADIAIDGSGNIFVADTYNNKIRKIAPDGMVSTLAGTGSVGSLNGKGSVASFNYPYGLTVDDVGNVYVSDRENHQIRKISPAGEVTTIAGTGLQGKANGIGVSASFYNPRGIVADHQKSIYVADVMNHLIRKIDLLGFTINPALPAGLLFDGKTGTISGTPSILFKPTNYTITAFNENGNSATNFTLSVVIPAEAPIITSITPSSLSPGTTKLSINGTNFLEASGVTIGGVSATSFSIVSPTTIIAAIPVGISSGNITVTNIYGTGTLPGFIVNQPPNISFSGPQTYETGIEIIPLVPTNSGSAIPAVTYGEVTTVAGNGSSGSANGASTTAIFKNPSSTVADAEGNIYVADAGNNLIRKISPDGTVSTFAGSGSASFADGIGKAASFNQPKDLAIDESGNLYVADYSNFKVRKITPAGAVSTLANFYLL